MKRAIVIGGGISGLATALGLADRAAENGQPLDVRVLEAGSGPGGNIRTDRVDGFGIEEGPNGWLDNVPATGRLVERLGLGPELQPANATAAKRFLYRRGRLHRLPGGPIGFLASPVLSLRGRLRVLGEPFARPRPAGRDETVREFAARRIGDEAARVLVDSMVSGIFAGNIDELSLRSTFPKMAEMEDAHGGLVRAMLARMKERRAARNRAREMEARGEDVREIVRPGGPAGPGGTLTSFRDGLDTIVKRLATELGPRLLCGHRVVEIAHGPGGTGWDVRTADGTSHPADALVVTLPSPLAAPLLERMDDPLARAVGEIRTASVAVVALGFEAAAIGGAPDGFGFLVPRGEGPRILGCLWDSSVFPGRAPEGRVLLRAMIGGAHDPEAVGLDDASLVEIVRADLEKTMGLRAAPLLTRVYRHPLGIGQYRVGHAALLERIDARLARLPGLWLGGSSYRGVSMNLCIERAAQHAAEIATFVEGSSSGIARPVPMSGAEGRPLSRRDR